MPPLRLAKIAVILLFVPVTLLFLRNSQILLHQSSNFVLFPLNYPESRTILLDNSAYLFYITANISAIDMLSIYSAISSEASSLVIFNDLSHSDNISISCSQHLSVLLSMGYTTSILYFPDSLKL